MAFPTEEQWESQGGCGHNCGSYSACYRGYETQQEIYDRQRKIDERKLKLKARSQKLVKQWKLRFRS